jgi:hypothetical protein
LPDIEYCSAAARRFADVSVPREQCEPSDESRLPDSHDGVVDMTIIERGVVRGVASMCRFLHVNLLGIVKVHSAQYLPPVEKPEPPNVPDNDSS